MRNIAFAGQMGAGKSTATDYLVENYGYNAAKISRPIYEIVEMLWGPEARKDRAKLQDLGMKMREIDPDVWINYYVEVTIGEGLDGEGPYANDTMRFPNEYWALRNKGDFVTVRVNCPEAKRVDGFRSWIACTMSPRPRCSAPVPNLKASTSTMK
jgi:hypothetical protein